MKKQVRSFVLLAAIAGSVSVISCKEVEKEEATPMQNEMHQEHEEVQKSDDPVLNDEITAEFKEESTAEIYQSYINIKQALVETDAAMAQDRAKEMLANLESSETNAELATAVRNISTSTDVNEQRKAFSELTKQIESQLQGAIETGEIYKQFCPMAFEGKGDYWFSNSKEIRNPYFGDKMLKCGRVEATISGS